MIKEIIATGKDVAEAKENARAALGADPLADVNFEVLHAGSRGIFGIIGVKPAQVRAYIELPDNAPKRKNKNNDRPRRENNAEGKRQDGNNKGEGNKKHRKPKTEKPERKADPKPEREISEVIPEESLKLERREVASGEDMSYEFVKTLLSDIGLNATAELYSCEDGTRRITIVGDDASVLIGHHGDTLDALQYLANLASAQKNVNGQRDKSRVTIDIEGYRAKREATLRALARRMAAKALRNKRSVMLEPMNAYERRIIHSEIHNIEGVSTNSVGSDNNRKIVIYLTDKKPKGIFDEDKAETTPLAEEFAAAEGEVAIETVGTEVATAELSEEEQLDETVSVEKTIPDESDASFTLADDELK
ncbi:MAG: Jag N-terminal domain-containing protein [Clostridia bacterium]|nr:Jag N-terminal domain-containing protein [Clostridia bacterium]